MAAVQSEPYENKQYHRIKTPTGEMDGRRSVYQRARAAVTLVLSPLHTEFILRATDRASLPSRV
jgi:hypothetical protein